VNKDIVKRLAIQSGIDLEFFQAGELFSFATAIVKQYQADNYQIRTDNTQTIANMEAKIAELEAKLAVAVYALEQYDEYYQGTTIAKEVLTKLKESE
jgi:hypothetical protein